jgi:hypothetical protein
MKQWLWQGMLVTAIALQTASSMAQVSVKPDETVVLSVHAVGAQVYGCVAEGGKLAWQLREPIATLIQDGETVPIERELSVINHLTPVVVSLHAFAAACDPFHRPMQLARAPHRQRVVRKHVEDRP